MSVPEPGSKGPPIVQPPPPPPPSVFTIQVTWPGPSWNIVAPANGAAYNQTVSVFCVSGSGTYQVQEISRPSVVQVAVDGVSSSGGTARISQSISAGETRTHTVTVYASPVGSGFDGAFAVVGPGGTSWSWTGNFY